MKNNLKQVWFLLLLLIAALLALSMLPDFTIFGIAIKKPDLLAEVAPDPPPPPVQDSIVATKDSVIVKPLDHRKGTIAIEDFGSDNLSQFFNALRSSRAQPVRVAFFGDSFIEGDIFCGPFRDTLQRLYSGSGVGYVPIASEVTKFRVSIQHDFVNWKTYSIVGQKSNDAPLGLPGYCFVPSEGNEVTYKPASKKFVTAKFFYEREQPSQVNCTLNDSSYVAPLPATTTLTQFDFAGSGLSSVSFSFPEPAQTRCYGAAFEDTVGVTVDNFAMRSNPGMGLMLVDQERMQQFNHLRNYKLVILQYGLNVLSEKDSTGYTWYLYKMTELIKRMKEDIPDCGFLLISIGDRCNNQNGKMATMPGVWQMRDVQRAIAQKSGIAFWDMFEAMGGENSIIKYTEAHPPLAAKDYTHLTFRGGRKIAKKLADALLYEKKRYERKR